MFLRTLKLIRLVLILCVLCVCCGLPNTSASAADYAIVKVLKVTDGDTIRVNYQGKNERVRLIGVNTPEIQHPTKGMEPYGPEASAYTKKILQGRKVYLEFDVEQRDRYGRLLAYLWIDKPNGQGIAEIRKNMFNARLLLDGYAHLMTVPPNVRYVDFFKKFQAEARGQQKGLWDKNKGTKTK